MAAPGHFDIDANVVFQLGDELVTSTATALVELIKNSYDADATFVNVIISTRDTYKEESFFPGHTSYILIEDNGFGMTMRTLRRGWLMISASPKRTMKQRGEKTPKGRVPLGEKGVGRLGTQRLGSTVEIWTKHKKGPRARRLGFSWQQFREVKALSEVSPRLAQADIKFSKGQGTKLLVTGLQDIEFWRDKESIENLEQELTKLISPYREVRDFKIAITIDGNSLDLDSFGDELRKAASIGYEFDFSGDHLEITGRFKRNYFKTDIDEVDYYDLVEADKGEFLFRQLREHCEGLKITVRRSSDKKWFVETTVKIPLDDIEGKRLVKETKGEKMVPANPGPFFGKIDSFDFSAAALKEQSVFDSSSEFKSRVQSFAGIRVYRDGFGIKVADDWLQLGKKWTSGSSYYGLKPSNTMGFVAISAINNSLVETTDRESFKETPEYENFFRILKRVIAYSSEIQEMFRRWFVKFVSDNKRTQAGISPQESAEDLGKRVANRISSLKDRRSGLSTVSKTLERAKLDLDSSAQKLAKDSRLDQTTKASLEAFRLELDTGLSSAMGALKELDTQIESIGSLGAQSSVLVGEISALKSSAADLYQAAGLGLTAEALSHEILNIADRVNQRTQSFVRWLDNWSHDDPKIRAYVEQVKGSATGLRKQVSHLAPGLRYVREIRDVFDVHELTSEFADFYAEQFGSKIKVIYKHDKKPFEVRINKGKLSQVIDNLVYNSRYWVKRAMDDGKIKDGSITIEVEMPFIRVFDSGLGVHADVENLIFQPFVTRKPQGVGRGLGLFIVRQLLDVEGCYITLLPVRNAHKRRFIFQVELSGCLTNENDE